MALPDLVALAETCHETAKALDALLAADKEVKTPIFVFPDVLGPGALTRGKQSASLKARTKLLDRVGVWGVHDYWNQAGTYWSQRYHELRAFPGVGAKPIWMTEWAQRYRHGDLASGVEFGAQILNSLRLGAEAWMVFEWCHPSGNQSGLISTDWGAKAPRERYWRSKAYHVFRQIANTTPAGPLPPSAPGAPAGEGAKARAAQVVSMSGRWKGVSQVKGSGVEHLAVRAGDKIVVHLMNTEPAPTTFRVSIRGPAGKVAAWQTTPLEDMAEVPAGDLKVGRQGDAATIAGVAPANSLVTLLVERTAGK
jgi:hypothetical protein